MDLKTRANSGSQAAYTIIEVVFASSIIAILFVTLHLGIAFGFSVSRAERENLRATQIILERMEGIRLFTFDQVSNTSLNPTTFTKSYYPPALGGQSPGITYTGTVTVVPNITLDPPATYSGDMKTVTVQLDWVSSNVHRTRSLTTYVARNGIQNYVISTNQ
jgi:type II secretory pathway pseudopilin PulG